MLAIWLFQIASASDVPRELQAAVAARQFNRAHIRWTQENPTKRMSRSHESRFAPGQKIEIEAWTQPGDSGVEPRTMKQLVTQNQVWTTCGSSLYAHLTDDLSRGPTVDVRMIGLDPLGGTNVDRVWQLSPAQRTYRTEMEGETVVVIANEAHDGAQLEVRWWIDPTRDYAVLRTQGLQDGKVRIETQVELDVHGGHWFPKSVSTTAEGRVTNRITVDYVEIEVPSLPERLRPEDIDVQPGTNIWRQLLDNSVSLMSWDGESVVPIDELHKRIDAGELLEGPDFRLDMERLKRPFVNSQTQPSTQTVGGGANLAILGRNPDWWTRYVEKFIRHYELSEAQKTKAWECRDDSRTKGDGYLSRNASAREEISAEVARATQMADANQRDQALDRARRRDDEHMEPVLRSFEELRSKLYALLTAEQRKRSAFDKPPPDSRK